MSEMEPVNRKQAAAMLADAGRQGLFGRSRGSGTKLAWSTLQAPGGDVSCSTKRLNTPIQH